MTFEQLEIGRTLTLLQWEEFTLLQSRTCIRLPIPGGRFPTSKSVFDSAEIDPEGESIQQLRHEAYRLAFYVGLTSRHLLEVGGEAGLALLMKEIGVEGNPELALMKIWSKVSQVADCQGKLRRIAE